MSADSDEKRSPCGDLIAPGLRLLIVAINPSSRSAGIGYSFSSPSNSFWRLLHESGLTPVQLQPCEEHRLLDHGIGLVSTVQRATPAAAELTVAERRAGAARVRGLVERHSPQVVALLGITLYPVFFRSGTSPGPGLKPERIHSAEVYVLPNPSGATGRTPASNPSSSGTGTSPITSHQATPPTDRDPSAGHEDFDEAGLSLR